MRRKLVTRVGSADLTGATAALAMTLAAVAGGGCLSPSSAPDAAIVSIDVNTYTRALPGSVDRRLELDCRVADPDAVGCHQLQSLVLILPGSDAVTLDVLATAQCEPQSGRTAYSWREDTGLDLPLTAGPYRVEAALLDGDVASVVDRVAGDPLAPPVLLQPRNGRTAGLTPRLVWEQVRGAVRYRVVVTDVAADRQVLSEVTAGAEFAIPAGVTALGRFYQWDVYAYDAAAGDDVDHKSRSARWRFYSGELP
ncbi:MAG: hypothetical protein HYV63_10035 [Candidatus Schekmanbacteria bacterium]|nr:hypothetical protein [Candidatus Schekmanbacteria bacterium]